MEPSPVNLGQLAATARHFARRLLTIGENRLALLMVEVQEERVRLLRAILLALGVAAFGFLAGVALTGTIVVLFWNFSPVAVLVALTGLYGAGGGLALPAAHAAAARLDECSGQLRSTPKGPRMFGKASRLSPLEARKQLLIAESELNRAQLSEEWQKMAHGVRDLAYRAKTIAAWVSAGALLVAGVTAWQRGPPAPGTAKTSWFQTILSGARLASTIWFAFRGRSEKGEPR